MNTNNGQEYFTNLIHKHKIVLFSKPCCHLCDEIKTYLKENSYGFENVDVTQLEDQYDIDGIELVEMIKSQTQSNMFPFCYYEGQYVDTHEIKKN